MHIIFHLLIIILIFSIIIGLANGFTSQILWIIKPITLTQYTSFLVFAMIVNKYVHLLKNYKSQVLTLCFFLLMATFFEMLWNYFFWFSLFNFYGIDADIDVITYTDLRHQIPLNITDESLKEIIYRPVNLNINTKLAVLVFFSTLYLTFRLMRLE